MRSTVGIIVAVKECQPVTVEELKLALLAMASIGQLIEDEARTLAEAVEADKPAAKLRAGFLLKTLERMFYARKKAPDEWLGPRNIPGTPENTKAMAGAKVLYKKATGEDL